MRIQGRALTVVTAWLILVVPGSPVGAEPGAASITLNPRVGPPTSSFTITGSGFQANETVALQFDTFSLGTATANGSGAFTKHTKVPKAATPGAHMVTATGESSGRTAQASFTVRTDWAQLGFVAAKSFANQFENVVSPSNVSLLTQKWSKTFGTFTFAAPTVAGGRVYMGATDGLRALDPATGATLWKANGDFSFAVAAAAGGSVFAGSGDGTIWALDASTGAVNWSKTLHSGYRPSNPAVSGGVVYLSDSFNTLYALNAATGAQIWAAAYSGTDTVQSPAVANGLVFMGGVLVKAFHTSDGSEAWSFNTGGNNDVTPAVSNGLVVVGASTGVEYGLNASTGTVTWQNTLDTNYMGTAAVSAGVVYVGGVFSGTVFALNQSNGTLKWTKTVGCCQTIELTTANGLVYGAVNGTSTVFALKASTGASAWQVTLTAAPDFSPVIADGKVYEADESGTIHAYGLP